MMTTENKKMEIVEGCVDQCVGLLGQAATHDTSMSYQSTGSSFNCSASNPVSCLCSEKAEGHIAEIGPLLLL